MAPQLSLDLPGGGKMPIVGFGALIFPKTPDDTVNVELVIENALQNGYRHIDTAHIYRSEKPIGNVIKRWIDAGDLKREDLFIVTKLPSYGIHPDRVEKFFMESLENLQLDYVDLYLIHHPLGTKYEEGKEITIAELVLEPDNDHVAIWKKLEEQVDAGRAKAIGLSNFSIPQIKKILAGAKIKPANIQVLLNVYHQQKELVQFCKEIGITVVAYSPLGKPRKPGDIPTPLAFNRNQPPPPPVILEDPVVNEIAKKYSRTPSQILLRFLIQKGIAVIPKSASPERQRENLDIFDFNLSDEDVKRLEDLDKQGTDEEHRPFVLPERWRSHPDFPTGI